MGFLCLSRGGSCGYTEVRALKTTDARLDVSCSISDNLSPVSCTWRGLFIDIQASDSFLPPQPTPLPHRGDGTQGPALMQTPTMQTHSMFWVQTSSTWKSAQEKHMLICFVGLTVWKHHRWNIGSSKTSHLGFVCKLLASIETLCSFILLKRSNCVLRMVQKLN